jgi:heme exporter protein B
VWRDALLVGAKDLRIEARSRVATNQVLPFALVVVLLFAFALDPDRGVLAKASSGLFWVAVMLSALLAVQRSMAIEAADGARERLRVAGLDPAGIFLGKAGAVAIQLAGLEVVLAVAVTIFYGARFGSIPVMVLTALAATIGLAGAGTVYGVLSAGLRLRETLLPLLLLPVVAPVLLGATRAWEAAQGDAVSEAWPWVRLLAVFAVVYGAFGIAAFGALLEDS